MSTIPSTITEQIQLSKKLEISYSNLHDFLILENSQSNTSIKIPFSSISNKYKDYLSSIVIEISLTDSDREHYMFKPKMLSEDLYGTTEFWDELLELNNAISVIDFKPEKTLKIYDPTRLKEMLNEILILEDNL